MFEENRILPDGTIVIFKRGYKWFKAKVGGKQDFFLGKTPFKSLSEVRKGGKYITIWTYLKRNHLPQTEMDVLLAYEVKSLYVKAKGRDSAEIKPKNKSEKSMEDFWWSELNEVCLTCINSCKQSSRVLLACCPQYVVAAGE